MSSLKYAIVGNEADTTNAVQHAADPQARPYLVSDTGERGGVSITRRAQEALDFELAHGSMPA